MYLASNCHQAQIAPEHPGEGGIYIYCVADYAGKASLGEIGLKNSDVYTIPYRDICAVVHRCTAQPYRLENGEVVEMWVLAHQGVVDSAWQRWGAVLPFSFDTVVKGSDECVLRWLEQHYEELRRKIEQFRGKAEYGVQVLWHLQAIARSVVETNPEIKKLSDEISTKSPGLAYMYRQKLENLIKGKMEARADECFRDFYRRLRQHADDIHVEKARKPAENRQMIMNLSCLVRRERYADLAAELDRIDQTEGFSVRFTGPWPPYSFVGGV